MTVLRRLWNNCTVRTQLLIAVASITVLAALLAGVLSIINTRVATRVEIQSSLEIAQRFVGATLKELASQNRLGELEQQLPLELKHLRHVRILHMDAFGQLTVVSPQESAGPPVNDEEVSRAPDWFAALVRPKLVGRAIRVVSVEHSDPYVIVGEPADEIAEAWRYFSTVALVCIALGILVLALLYVVLGRVLDPLANLYRGMLNLEDGQYTTRLTEPKVRELAMITNRFNLLAGALDTARAENRRLYQQLISVQEQERREIAHELHDEAGPCLFGITALASSVQNLAEQGKGRRNLDIAKRVGEILSITGRLKLMNRGLLKKLRPSSLGRISLADLLGELIDGFKRRHPDIAIVLSPNGVGSSYGEDIDLAVYRCAQEAITNAIQHGKADRLTVDLTEERLGDRSNGSAKRKLSLRVRDNGEGFDPVRQRGFGLTTMSERIRSLGGDCKIDSVAMEGSTISIDIPIARIARNRRVELAGALS